MFITNEENKNLGDRISKLIKDSKELKFLTAFFYLSSIPEIYSSLKEKYEKGDMEEGFMKVLIGLNIDLTTYCIYEHTFGEKPEEDFLKSLEKAFNSQDLDTKEVYDQVEFFLKLLKENKVILRKTREPNHAKLYIFKLSLEAIDYPIFITGSSNLTRAGLNYQNEFNIEIGMKEYGIKAQEYFDKLWEDAIEISPKKVETIIREKTFMRQITPFEAWLYLLKLYLDLNTSFEKEEWERAKEILEKAGYKPYKYQVEAILQGFRSLKEYNGVLLADVVGLGKSVIACGIARMFGKRGLVICPPHLVGDKNANWGWEKYLSDFKLNDWEVRSLGKLEEVLDLVKRNDDIELIIVDEAHRFRNENTQRYHYLHEICRGKMVILLTATPFNNRPSDIYALLKLFTVPKKSNLIINEDIENTFKEYEDEFKELLKEKKKAQSHRKKEIEERFKEIAKEIRSIIEPITIRRNRLDLKYYGEEIPMPKVKDPIACYYELTKEQSEFYDEVIRSFEEDGKFKGAIYYPSKYLKDKEKDIFLEESQKNLYNFMRRLLVKRFESSFKAFYESINNFIELHNKVSEFVERTKTFILDRKFMEDLLEVEDDESIEEAIKQYIEKFEENIKDKRYKKVYKLEDLRNEFEKHIEEDIKLFKRIKERMEKMKLLEEDPKVEKLIQEVKKYIDAGRKVLIFTEYVDTANYLDEKLQEVFGDKVLTATGKLSKIMVDKINNNFNAEMEDEGKYHILITTDRLSEGFNLHRAGVVINYDIPWNPVRVIQRVGRINRIGKKVYEEIYILNFFPTEKGENETNQRKIAESKMFMIHNILGEDAKIFSPEEEPNESKLYERLTKNPEELEEESFITSLRKEWKDYQKEYRDIIQRLDNMPTRLKVAKPYHRDELIVVVKSGTELFVVKNEQESIKFVGFEDVYESIKAQPNTPRLPHSPNFWNSYNKVLKQLFEKRQRTKLANNLRNINSAFSVIRTVEREYGQMLSEDEREFLENIKKDIESYGTLTEEVIRRIKEWEKYLNNLEKLKESINDLMDELGKDFLGKTIREREKEKLIIISIENRRQENGEAN
ncbi:MAG: helicase-related protein [candidate division WOR-3 bacterium]